MTERNMILENMLFEYFTSKEYSKVTDFDPKKLVDREYLVKELSQMMRTETKAPIDCAFWKDVFVNFSSNVIEAAHIMLAVSLYRTCRDRGILTEEEYRDFAEDGEKRWRKLLNDDIMQTNRVV